MATFQNRGRNPCTSYKREGRTKQNVFECLPSSGDYQGGCEGKKFRTEGRANQDVYECCPPTPLELRCSVCYTAERDGCNLWTCVPFVSYSVLCGPTLADLLVLLLNLLPMSFLACLGIAHPRCCKEKAKPFIKNCNPEKKPPRCVPVNRCGDRREVKRTSYPKPEAGDTSSCNDDIYAWMHGEYEALAQELAEIKRLTTEDNDTDNRDLLQARNYVLDRLAEMLAMREEIERKEKKKQSR
ncbi:uncharacterized protein LOC128991086 [Macrosteles quadrilineatus]|uniref:uncharacterized protein LOC128991086 n=1 Tax=Macrosteles quadrilineatus TaxID=74068 RepID=UPI0023E2906C|nr:uncharacterized protein LOC128991086 [Macrosteles quadrilineatus]